jgi:hypothetical protein
MKCPQCDFENEEGSKFCKNCNVLLSKQDYSEDNPYTKKNIDEEEKIRKRIEREEEIREEVKADTEFLESRESRERFERDNKKGTKQLLGLIGSAVLFVGVFAPIISLPIVGNMNYFQNGKGDGTIILVLAVISFIVVLLKMFCVLWFTGLGSIALLVFAFVNFQKIFTDINTQTGTELAGNPFGGLADMAMQSVQIQWGWALLIIGAILLIASAAIKDK